VLKFPEKDLLWTRRCGLGGESYTITLADQGLFHFSMIDMRLLNVLFMKDIEWKKLPERMLFLVPV